MPPEGSLMAGVREASDSPVNDLGSNGPFSVVEIEHVDRVRASYERLHPRLWHALCAYSGSHDVATDAEAEAFAQVIRRGDAVRDLDAWVWRSAFMLAKGMLADRLGTLTVIDTPDRLAEPSASVAEFISQLDGLSDQQRAIVVLRYVGQFTPTEIAGLLHTTAGSVRVQLHRAHERLRPSLERTHD